MRAKPNFRFSPTGLFHFGLPVFELSNHLFSQFAFRFDEVFGFPKIFIEVVEGVAIVLHVNQFPWTVAHRREPELVPV